MFLARCVEYINGLFEFVLSLITDGNADKYILIEVLIEEKTVLKINQGIVKIALVQIA
jgi:hypothetical protein